MIDKGTENILKQAAIQDFCRALRYQDQSIVSMAYDSDREAVQIKCTCGSIWVDVTGKNIHGMLAAVFKELANEQGSAA
jgi:di/tripeptidase